MKSSIILILISMLAGPLFAQTASVEKNSDGTTAVTLEANGQKIASCPTSLPSLLNLGNTDVPEPGKPASSLFNWSLKFTAIGKVFKDVSFADDHTGYIVTELGAVYKTVNGGDNWTSVMNLGFPYYWYGVHALTPDTVVIAGFNNQAPTAQGVIRWSYDGGSTWQPNLNLPIPVSGVGWLDKVHFFSADTGIVFNSFSGGAWVTVNGGKDSASWNYVIINSDQAWFAGNIDADLPGKLYATGIHFAQSQDFGITWTSGPCADQTFDGGVDFLDSDSQLGWTGGGQISAPVSGWIHRSTDGGMSWSGRLQTFSYPIRALSFFNASTGLALGGNVYSEAGGIYSTPDSGYTWNLEMNTAAEMFALDYKIISADSMDIWCVGSTGGGTGYKGKLYKARTVNLVTGIKTNPGITMNQARLDQNTPNPFSESTIIGFYIPRTSRITLKLFNLFGSEVMTLSDGIRAPGYNTVTLSSQNLPDGIYYYRLQAGNQIETRKLIIMKQ